MSRAHERLSPGVPACPSACCPSSPSPWPSSPLRQGHQGHLEGPGQRRGGQDHPGGPGGPGKAMMPTRQVREAHGLRGLPGPARGVRAAAGHAALLLAYARKQGVDQDPAVKVRAEGALARSTSRACCPSAAARPPGTPSSRHVRRCEEEAAGHSPFEAVKAQLAQEYPQYQLMKEVKLSMPSPTPTSGGPGALIASPKGGPPARRARSDATHAWHPL